MRPGQNKRMRGRNRRGPNPLTRSFESNGPDVKVRGTAQHVAEKYTQLARDAHVSGDPVAAENYLQHAEHYYRIIAAAHQAQQALQNGGQNGDDRDDADDEDFDPVNDRFTFRSPQAIQQQQNGQPFIGDRQPGEFGEGGEEREGEEGLPERSGPERPQDTRPPMRHHRDDRRGGRGPDRNFRPRGEGGDRPFQDRNFQDRNFQDRGNQERSGQERSGQERFNPGFRPRPPRPEIDPAGEQPVMPALPAFLTAPTRPLSVVPVEPAGEEPLPGAEGEEGARGTFRARRRRRSRGAREGAEGVDEGVPVAVVSGDDAG